MHRPRLLKEATERQRLIAMSLSYYYPDPKTWDWTIIDQLELVWDNYGEDVFWKEVRKLVHG